MDTAQREQIVRQHGPLVNRRVPATTLNRVNIRHITGSAKTPSIIQFANNALDAGSASVEESGPPSPQGGPLVNFAVVSTGIYRSALPFSSNLDHLRSLHLKTMVTLVETPFDAGILDFLRSSNIKHYRIPIPAHKEGRQIAIEDIAQVMRLLTNPCYHPLLLHCNKGKHRTGCMVASFRLLAHHNDRNDWTHKSADPITEYTNFSKPKSRLADIAFITNFSPRDTLHAIAATEYPAKPIDYARPGTPAPLPPSSPSKPPAPFLHQDMERRVKIEEQDPLCRATSESMRGTRRPPPISIPSIPTALPPLTTPLSAVAGTEMGSCGNLHARGYSNFNAAVGPYALPTPPPSVPDSRTSIHEGEMERKDMDLDMDFDFDFAILGDQDDEAEALAWGIGHPVEARELV